MHLFIINEIVNFDILIFTSRFSKFYLRMYNFLCALRILWDVNYVIWPHPAQAGQEGEQNTKQESAGG